MQKKLGRYAMLVFFKQRLVILSVPKTGSTALHEVLGAQADLVISGPPSLKHAPLYRFNRFIRPMYEKVCGVDLDVMAVVREPVSWLGSWYRYRQRPELEGQLNSTAGLSFDEFVTAYCSATPPAFAKVGSQAAFLETRPNGARAKYLFAYDDRLSIEAFLAERLGTVPTMQRVNVSPRKELALSDDVETLLRKKHAASFALYASALKGNLPR